MLLSEAKEILEEHGYIIEKAVLRYDFNELGTILNLLFMDGNGEIKESSNNGKIWKYVIGDIEYDVNYIFEYDDKQTIIIKTDHRLPDKGD